MFWVRNHLFWQEVDILKPVSDSSLHVFRSLFMHFSVNKNGTGRSLVPRVLDIRRVSDTFSELMEKSELLILNLVASSCY